MRKYNDLFKDICEQNNVTDSEAGVMLEICALFCILAKKRKSAGGVKIAVPISLSSLSVMYERLGAQ